MGDFGNFLNGFAKSPRLIVLNIDWVQFVLKNCEIPHSVRGLCDKKYKTLVYTPPDLLAKIYKVHLSNAKKFGLICFPRICFRGLICCDQEPLWLLNVMEDVCYFLGVHTCIFRLSTRCKMFHSKITYRFPQKSHECALKLTDFLLWGARFNLLVIKCCL